METKKSRWRRLEEFLNRIHLLHWLLSFFPKSWMALLTAFFVGSGGFLLALVRHINLAAAWLYAIGGIVLYVLGWLLVQAGRYIKERIPVGSGWFAFDFPQEVHNHIPFEAFIRGCGPRTVRNIVFDPLKSRQDLEIRFDSISSLAPGERVRLGFRKWNDEIGHAGNVVNFFEGGLPAQDQPPYTLIVQFLDGAKKRTESHVVEGHPLPKGGITLKICPVTVSTT